MTLRHTPTIGIIGCGRMGTALAELLASARFPLILASRSGRSAELLADRLPGARDDSLERLASEADVIVMATAVDVTYLEVSPRIRVPAAGKPVIDVSNPGFHRLPPGSGCDSAAELIACALPGSAVVKALNCVPARRLRDVAGAPRRPTVPIAGDDASAKRTVRLILERAGLEVADAGDLRGSRWIEALAELLVRLGEHAGIGDAVGFQFLSLSALEPTEKGRVTR